MEPADLPARHRCSQNPCEARSKGARLGWVWGSSNAEDALSLNQQELRLCLSDHDCKSVWGLCGYVSLYVGFSVFVAVCGPWPVSICVCVWWGWGEGFKCIGVGVSYSGEGAPFFHTPASGLGHLPLRDGWDGSWPLRTTALLNDLPQEPRFCVLPHPQSGRQAGPRDSWVPQSAPEAHPLLSGLVPWERAQCWLHLGDLVEVRGRGGVSTQMQGGRGGLPCLGHSQSAKGERWKLSLLGKKTY